MDEEYLACAIDCILAGTTESENIAREKTRRILKRKPALAARIEQGRSSLDDRMAFNIELNRVRKVILKLARGHTLFELNEPQIDEPTFVGINPLCTMSVDRRASFESSPASSIWPEVGSRAMSRMVVDMADVVAPPSWVTVQEGRYRYLTILDNTGVVIRMVLSEYLACEVRWSFFER